MFLIKASGLWICCYRSTGLVAALSYVWPPHILYVVTDLQGLWQHCHMFDLPTYYMLLQIYRAVATLSHVWPPHILYVVTDLQGLWQHCHMFDLPTYYVLLQIYRACGSTVICLTSPHIMCCYRSTGLVAALSYVWPPDILYVVTDLQGLWQHCHMFDLPTYYMLLQIYRACGCTVTCLTSPHIICCYRSTGLVAALSHVWPPHILYVVTDLQGLWQHCRMFDLPTYYMLLQIYRACGSTVTCLTSPHIMCCYISTGLVAALSHVWPPHILCVVTYLQGLWQHCHMFDLPTYYVLLHIYRACGSAVTCLTSPHIMCCYRSTGLVAALSYVWPPHILCVVTDLQGLWQRCHMFDLPTYYVLLQIYRACGSAVTCLTSPHIICCYRSTGLVAHCHMFDLPTYYMLLQIYRACGTLSHVWSPRILYVVTDLQGLWQHCHMFDLPTYYVLLQIYRACGSTVICLTSPHIICCYRSTGLVAALSHVWPPHILYVVTDLQGLWQHCHMFDLPTYYVLLQIYRACGSTVICYPLLFETSDFYLCQDMRLVLDDVKVVHASAPYCGILLVHPPSASSNTCQMHYFSSSACPNTPTWLLARDAFVAAMEASVRVSKVKCKASQLKWMTVFSLGGDYLHNVGPGPTFLVQASASLK